jgi:hypothetical protein
MPDVGYWVDGVCIVCGLQLRRFLRDDSFAEQFLACRCLKKRYQEKLKVRACLIHLARHQGAIPVITVDSANCMGKHCGERGSVFKCIQRRDLSQGDKDGGFWDAKVRGAGRDEGIGIAGFNEHAGAQQSNVPNRCVEGMRHVLHVVAQFLGTSHQHVDKNSARLIA